MRRLTPAAGPLALVVALLALVVAVGGTSYAAVTLAKNSVGAKQLKAGAVTGAKVKDASLGSADFAPGQLPSGAPGPVGPAGPAGPVGPTGGQGAAGAPGVSGFTTVTQQLAAGGSLGGNVAATCPAGTRVIGGTGGASSDAAYVWSTTTSSDGTVFLVQVASVDDQVLPAGTSFHATASCARVSP